MNNIREENKKLFEKVHNRVDENILKNEQDEIIGKMYNVIEILLSNINCIIKEDSEIGQEEKEFLTIETNNLILDILSENYKIDDIIKLHFNQMADFYVLADDTDLKEDLENWE